MSTLLAPPAARPEVSGRYSLAVRPVASIALERPLTADQAAALESYCAPRSVVECTPARPVCAPAASPETVWVL